LCSSPKPKQILLLVDDDDVHIFRRMSIICGDQSLYLNFRIRCPCQGQKPTEKLDQAFKVQLGVGKARKLSRVLFLFALRTCANKSETL
jgi:hypothetical protein